MTKEELVNRLLSIDKQISTRSWITAGGDLGELIDELQEEINREPSLPSNLDEAADKYMQTLCDRADDNLRIDTTLQAAFKAGAEWMAGHGVTDMVYGTVCGRVRDHINVKFADGIGELLVPKSISHIPADVSKYNIGDKVTIQILKK